jgi:hypothetical protein
MICLIAGPVAVGAEPGTVVDETVPVVDGAAPGVVDELLGAI